ncbi:methylated-DNA--[protein]-cysteine S-methyltransferase [Membranihabitans marinus]|nr:methylated-DNA--[protein]-cysteine S-methyltransferase [Membranihabitans marinus]
MEHRGLVHSPVGVIELKASDHGLRSLIIRPKAGIDPLMDSNIDEGCDKALDHVVEQLQAYFEGNLHRFSISIDWVGWSPFYIGVWRLLQTIPFGKFRSYQQIADFLDQPKSARAIGNANSKNPIPIIIPCHRVIGSNGKLTGYIYGKDIKRQLLYHENRSHFCEQGQLFV